jgi:hypothetical protein
VSAPEDSSYRTNPADAVAGFLAACALLVGPIAIAYHPVRLGVASILLALIASGIGGRFSKLAAAALAVAGASLLAGMIIAVITDNAIL